MKSSWRVFTWRGAPVTVDWTMVFAWPLLAMLGRGWTNALLALPAFVLLLLAHEMGHAYVARLRGSPVLGIDLYVMHGACRYEQPYYEYDDVLIAWGGVAAQALLLACAWPALWALPWAPHAVRQALAPSLNVLVGTNLLIALINLLPVAPLDGAKAWRILPYLLRGLGEKWQAYQARARKRGGLRLVRARARRDERVAQQAEQRLGEDAESARLAAEVLARLQGRKD